MEKLNDPDATLPTESRGTLFADMTGLQKGIFVVKLIVCIGTFGFVFPHVQSD